MVAKQQFEVWKDEVFPVLTSKVEEFHLLGYKEATVEEVWQCVLYKLKRQKELIRMHEFVSVILTMKITDYMNWLTISAYQAPNWFETSENDLF